MASKFHSKAKLAKPIRGVRVHSVKECSLSVADTPIHYIPQNALAGKRTVNVYEKSGTRRIIVPSHEPQEKPAILPQSEYDRLKEESIIVSQEEQKQMQIAAEEKKIKESEECEARKEMLREITANQQKIKDSALSEYESEAKKKNMYLLQRAYDLKQEQEDEVKAANRLILAAKCSAIRNAQLIEKELIKRETEKEEQRLDMMMEQQRQKEMRREEEHNEKNVHKQRQFIEEMNKQARENELRRMMEFEAIQEENRRMNQALIAIQQEEQEKIKKRHDTCIKNAEELKSVNDEMEKYKLMEREESKIADMKIAEYMRKKIEADEAREKEKLEQKKRKEMELLRQQAILQKQSDLKAQMDELHALRIQEEHEREWRNKERKQAIMEKQKEEELRHARIQQIDDLRRMQALEITRDEQEFKKAVALQQKDYEKHKQNEEQRKQAEANFRADILKQITENERERIKEKREKFEEGEALRLELKIKNKHVKEVLQRKVQSLKNTGLPEKYIKDIECHLKL